jgi:hypothetical protein
VQRDCYTLVYSQRVFFLLFITYIRRRKLPAITNISETVWRVPDISGARYLRLITRNAQYIYIYTYIVYIVVCCLNSFFLRCLMGIASVIQPAIRTRPNKFLSLSAFYTHWFCVYTLLFSHGWGDSAVRRKAKRWHLTKDRDHQKERESTIVTRVCSGNELLRPAPITSEIRNSVIIYRPKTNTHTITSGGSCWFWKTTLITLIPLCPAPLPMTRREKPNYYFSTSLHHFLFFGYSKATCQDVKC